MIIQSISEYLIVLGDVVYSIDGFLEKNRDTLSEDFKHLLSQSENPVIAKMWPEEKKNKDFITQRSLTAGSLFRTKIINLINLLRSKVRSFTPHSSTDILFSGIIFHSMYET